MSEFSVYILARQKRNYSNDRFREEAEKRNLSLGFINPADLDIVIGHRQPMLFRKGGPLKPVDGVTPRMGASITPHGLAVLAQFERMGTVVVNKSMPIIHTRDKLRCIQMMSRYDVNIPRTVVIRRPDYIHEAVELVGGFPVIIKLVSGTQGVGVMLAENLRTVDSTVGTLWSLGQEIILQECIQESLGKDIRAVVVGGKVVGAMRRQARLGEFRSNLHRGGMATPLDLDQDYERVAIRAAKIVGLEVAGVDILESKDGPKVIEVNSSPGLEGIEGATEKNIAGAILDYMIEMMKREKGVR